jgi:hypothetical protein
MDDDDTTRKMKWWERTGLARTGKNKPAKTHGEEGDKPASGPASVGRFDEASPDQQPPPIGTPGAVAVRGPGYRGDDEDEGNDDEDASTTRAGGERAGVDAEASEAPPYHVASYAVNEGATDEEIRQRILASTAHAEAVTVVGDEPKTRTNRSKMLVLMAVVVVAAVAVGVSVPLATRSQTTRPGAEGQGEDVVASFKYLEYQGSGGFAGGVWAQTRLENGAVVTSGSDDSVQCRPNACLESDESCVVGEVYSPGCCAGAGCPNETQCGQNCPPPPYSCYLTDPSNKSCIQSGCYTCSQEGGKDIYSLIDYAFAIDCLEVGSAVRPENGQTYKWAIFCGPVILGPVIEENRDLGEYQCGAVRLGANYSDDSDGLLAFLIPCQYIALRECGCGPSDMFTFGLPDPTGTCLPESGCPFLCEDAGPQYARELCRSFPGNISWWEGNNAFNSSMFPLDQMASEYEFEIYIKGVDS